MCNGHLRRARTIERAFGIAFGEYFAAELAELTGAGLARDRRTGAGDGQRRSKCTPTGRLFIRNVCMVFDRYLRARTADGQARLQPHGMTARARRRRRRRHHRAVAARSRCSETARRRGRRSIVTVLDADTSRRPCPHHRRGRLHRRGRTQRVSRSRARDAGARSRARAGVAAGRGAGPKPSADSSSATAGCAACPNRRPPLVTSDALSFAASCDCWASRSRQDRPRAWTRRYTTSRAAASARKPPKCWSTPPSPEFRRATAARCRCDRSFRSWWRWSAITAA